MCSLTLARDQASLGAGHGTSEVDIVYGRGLCWKRSAYRARRRFHPSYHPRSRRRWGFAFPTPTLPACCRARTCDADRDRISWASNGIGVVFVVRHSRNSGSVCDPIPPCHCRGEAPRASEDVLRSRKGVTNTHGVLREFP